MTDHSREPSREEQDRERQMREIVAESRRARTEAERVLRAAAARVDALARRWDAIEGFPLADIIEGEGESRD